MIISWRTLQISSTINNKALYINLAQHRRNQRQESCDTSSMYRHVYLCRMTWSNCWVKDALLKIYECRYCTDEMRLCRSWFRFSGQWWEKDENVRRSEVMMMMKSGEGRWVIFENCEEHLNLNFGFYFRFQDRVRLFSEFQRNVHYFNERRKRHNN